MSDYSSKLRDPRWQRKRLEVLEAVGWACQNCGEESKELQVHHMLYKRGKNPWEYNPCELVVLCENCHLMVEKGTTSVLTLIAQLAANSSDHHPYRQTIGFFQNLAYGLINKNDKLVPVNVGPDLGMAVSDMVRTMHEYAPAIASDFGAGVADYVEEATP